MESGTHLPLSHRPKKSGSDSRQKQRIIGLRVTAEHYGKLDAAAASEHLTVPSYVRECMLKAPGVRARRRPLADVAALSKLTAELNRIGGNINQIARVVNYGDMPEGRELRETLADLHATMKAARRLMGFEA